MFFVGGVAGIVLLLLWVYCIFDVIGTDETLVRNMPKIMWLLIVILVPTVGSVAWLVLGRPEAVRPGPVQAPRRPEPRARGPEDSPDFMMRASDEARRLRKWEEELRRREEDLRRREEGSPEGD